MARSSQAHPHSSLLVVAPPGVSDFIRKGEVVDRYYNPGCVFDRVEIWLTAVEAPPPESLSVLTGGVPTSVHVLPLHGVTTASTYGYRKSLVRSRIEQMIRARSGTRPDLIRCYGTGAHSLLAAKAAEQLRSPLCTSVHTYPPASVGTPLQSFRQSIGNRMRDWMTRESLRKSEMVLPVYESIVPYLREVGVHDYEVVYNVLNSESLHLGDRRDHSGPFRLVCVSRQVAGKDPRPILEALATIPDVTLTLVGEGALHEAILSRIGTLGLHERVRSFESLPNGTVCEMLHQFDAFVMQTDYPELPKGVMEAMLRGVPVIINSDQRWPVPELTSRIATLVESSAGGYREGIRSLIADPERRHRIARDAGEFAAKKWHPVRTEARYAEIHRELVQRGRRD